ncbi:DUF6364 family protein [Haloferula sp. A504]|uniref:DUF6364 family protein n=1 Tax=Haloferula sp. A504 TaxID=3373601 RepID=UPI0031BDE3C3|nr:DUF6364 family protein [Verrucomicrobiaceae bacterium E54]
MKNITLKIDDDTYRRARSFAAKSGTSVSALVRQFLERQIEDDESHDQRVKDLEALYRAADKRARPRKRSLKPLTRGEIHDERLR